MLKTEILGNGHNVAPRAPRIKKTGQSRGEDGRTGDETGNAEVGTRDAELKDPSSFHRPSFIAPRSASPLIPRPSSLLFVRIFLTGLKFDSLARGKL